MRRKNHYRVSFAVLGNTDLYQIIYVVFMPDARSAVKRARKAAQAFNDKISFEPTRVVRVVRGEFREVSRRAYS